MALPRPGIEPADPAVEAQSLNLTPGLSPHPACSKASALPPAEQQPGPVLSHPEREEGVLGQEKGTTHHSSPLLWRVPAERLPCSLSVRNPRPDSQGPQESAGLGGWSWVSRPVKPEL